MIHISVPDTQTLVEKADGVTKYTAYNIYVNGAFHAAVRFSKLIEFADAIKQRYATKKRLMLRFPSKQFFPLDEKGIEQRRIKISKYFNQLVQSPEIVRSFFVVSDVFWNFKLSHTLRRVLMYHLMYFLLMATRLL
ncbi:hypothetical protein KIN20_005587 [Parelaphostrongylus tenuis]|uniref:PX domain-containing protein n=1 Tax=Parelaphostrongylus tenuis TaxID=148309 RepID=A0AAD5M2E3_PARTN|nr:hypothetical protein KIN20_005587 [Parelaphostrongylus tenuis]